MPRDPTLEGWWSTTIADLGDVRPDSTLRTAEAPTAGAPPLPRLALGHPDEEPSDLRLEQKIGEGGMGVVYLARQATLDRHVAVKLVRNAQPHAGMALLREGQFMGRLEHPNVIPVHALGQGPDGQPILVMKHVQGVSWRVLLEDPHHDAWGRRLALGSDALTRNIHVLLEVCSALSYAHACGVVHRDLKPDNVMIGAFGEVYLLDWGIALSEGHVVEAGRLEGTPAYLAPEMLRRPSVATPLTDVCLVGACLHEILTGAPPHQGGTLQEVLEAASLAAPATYGPSVPEELGRLANHCRAPSPADRPSSIDAVRDALAGWLRHAGALHVVELAEARVEQLTTLIAAEADPVAIDRTLTSAMSAFDRALSEWPDARRARDGRTRALLLGVEHHLAAGDLTRAEVLLVTLEASGVATVTLRARLDEERRKVDRVRRFADDLDYTVAAGPRRVAVLGSVGALAAVVVYATAYRAVRGESEHAARHVVHALAINLVTWALVAWTWPALRRNRANRQVTGSLLAFGGSWLLLRFALFLAGATPRYLYTADLVLCLVVLLLLGIFGRLWLAAPTPWLAVGAIAVASSPTPQAAFLGVVGLSGVTLAVAWRRHGSIRTAG